ncbi:hypothetical protein ANN_13101 [Periplaneta americana]|uniref:Uncharacterized protein n=1 Tax=Periplaneta americana TaxID=6978 RepID=A0ABQ8TKP2_PERAM|nr:hypothetical protein ANN_13101 [Periplaneta americana]
MAGLCDGSNEPAGSLKAICNSTGVAAVLSIKSAEGPSFLVGLGEQRFGRKLRTRLRRAPCRFLPATERSPPAKISEPRPVRNQTPPFLFSLSVTKN